MPIRNCPSRRADRLAQGLRIAAICAVLGSCLTSAYPATALGLGEIVQQSSLGEPFRVTIPVLVNPDDLAGDDLAPECFRLVASESGRSADLPQVLFGRATLARNAQGVFVIVTSNSVANDPALSFTVQAGCRLRIRHEYTVLLDPPIISEPVAEAAARPETARPTSATPAIVAGTRAVEPGMATVTPAPSGTRARSSASRGPPVAAKHAPKTAKNSIPPKAKPTTNAAAAGATDDNKPRLRVSRSSQEQTARGASDIAGGKSDEEIRQDLEAETVVLQRRIAELSATLERMQADVREATAAREAAERPAKAPAPPPPPAWEPSPWLVSLLLLLMVLVLMLMIVRSRRAPLATAVAAPVLAHAATPAAMPLGGDDGEEEPRDAVPQALTAVMPTPLREEDEPLAMRASAPESEPDEDAFEDDLFRYAEQRSTYSVLEREHPKVVASVVRDWGKPKVIAYLREILVSPRKPSGGFSREAVSDLMFLQAIAMERAGYRPEDNPWHIELGNRRRGEA